MMLVCVQVGRAAQTSNKKRSMRLCPRSVWTTSGWNCTPYMRLSGSSIAATGASGVLAVATNPGGAPVIASPWLIHTSDVAPASNTASSIDGAQSLYTDSGPPDRMIPRGLRARSSSTGVS